MEKQIVQKKDINLSFTAASGSSIIPKPLVENIPGFRGFTSGRIPGFIRGKAPLRISFVGGGTDIPVYYEKYGGAVLCSTMNHYVRVSLSPRDDGQISIYSLDFDVGVKYHLAEPPVYHEALKLVLAAVSRLSPHTGLTSGFSISVQSDAPVGSGLGGSASLTVALLGTLMEYLRLHQFNKREIAELAYTVERLDLGISGGKQDQYEASFGGFNLIEFGRDRIVVTPLRLSRDILNDLEHHCLLCYTGRTRASAKVVDQFKESVNTGRKETLDNLDQTHRLVYDMKNALLCGELFDFAKMLDHAWQMKLKHHPESMVTPVISEMYHEARLHGAVAGKLLGAGAGGYLLLFCEGDKKRKVRERLQKLGGQFMDFSFVDEGVETWRSNCL
jgi:D-glycero-alpha-D-manno-heptose-7-phosphate kinase